MTVGLVLVSHSEPLAGGLAQLAAQMAPSVPIVPAGGGDDGGIGTSFEKIGAALSAADTGSGVVVLYDLGSALLTTETAIEFAEPEQQERWRIVDAPLAEGAVAAAVVAEGGGDLDAVARAAAQAAAAWAAEAPAADEAAEPAGPAETADVRIVNPLGLHARPAAELSRALAGTSATVRIGRIDGSAVDLRSVLGVVGLGLRGGDAVRIRVWGPDGPVVLHRLIELIAGGFGESGPSDRPAQLAAGDTTARAGVDGAIQATAGSPGLALGPLRRLDTLPTELPIGVDPGSGEPDQQGRLDAAIAIAAKHLAAQGAFGQAHAALAADPSLRQAAADRIEQDGAAVAWWRAVIAGAAELEDSPDELIAARAVDLREAGLAVLGELGVTLHRVGPRVHDAVVVADDVGPAEVPELVAEGARAVVLTAGSTTAHAVIVARGLGLPMVLRTGTTLDATPAGTTLLVDGDTGTVVVDPPPDVSAEATTRIADAQATAAALRAAAAAPVFVAGRQILVAANVGSIADARAAVENGADAVGLLRTELLVLDKPQYPDEEAQTADLAAIFEVLGDRPVVVRVLDAGGDKPVATLDLDPQRNGFLGVRGLRYLLQRPELLHTQLRAICRAAVHRRMSVMAPMVTVRAEAVAFRDAVDAAVASLVAEGIAHAAPEQVGIMIEVPAAALAADQFAGVVDFFSVGSNDLTSYTMAADRTEPAVADLLDPGAPAVSRLLDQLCAAAAEAGIPVAVCGEMAGLPEFALALVHRGVDELSMAPARIPALKAVLRDTADGQDPTG